MIGGTLPTAALSGAVRPQVLPRSPVGVGSDGNPEGRKTTLDREIRLREHVMGWHHGRYLTGKCPDCAAEYRRVRRAAGHDRQSRAKARWVQPDLWAV